MAPADVAKGRARLNEVWGLPFSQAEVGFVIPDLQVDLPLCVDPFLLFKSNDAELRLAHDRLIAVFNEAIRRYAGGNTEGASDLIQFPEAGEIGFGYARTNTRGSGLGEHFNALVLETLGASPGLVRRGVRHVEEMQLVSLGIGPDRVSDIAANILKSFFIEYTQTQCDLWHIPVEREVPVHHVLDFDTMSWLDGYFELPVSRIDGKTRPLILVPRRVVRQLPWINFDDYQRQEFGVYLRGKEIRRVLRRTKPSPLPPKQEVVAITRREIERIDHYVDRKEKEAASALPADLSASDDPLCEELRRLEDVLLTMPSGITHAQQYQDLMFRIFNILFEPDLIEGRPQIRTEAGTEIRDLIYTNDPDKPFLDFLRNAHKNLSLVVELKNKQALDHDDINQLAGYLGDPLGYCGILVSRVTWADTSRAKAIAWYNKGSPHRIVLHLDDASIVRMLRMRCLKKDPVAVLRGSYQDFAAKIQ